MKNWEYYKDDIKQYGINCFAIKKDGTATECYSIQCKECKFINDCVREKTEFLYEEYKGSIKLSQLEFELLKYFSKKYDYICKEEIVYFENKSNKEWVNLEDWGEDLFVWLNKGEFPIQNILDNCEVVDNEKI